MPTAKVHTTKLERVRAALQGDHVDHPPISFWAHNFARENDPRELTDETVSVFRKFDWDFIKIQCRASAFGEMWGLRYAPSTQRATPPTLLEWPVHSVDDLAKIAPIEPTTGALGEQLEALVMIREMVGKDAPIIHTVFAPSMVFAYLVNGVDNMLSYIRRHPQESHAALAILQDGLEGYAQACIEHGADGIFYAIKAAGAEQMTLDEYLEFGLPYDRPVLRAAGDGWLNMLHLCGNQLYFDVVESLATPLVNWMVAPGNPTLAEGRSLAQRAVIGGVSPKPDILTMTPQQVTSEVRAALEATNGERMMVGPGCSISPDTPDENLFAAKKAVLDWVDGSREHGSHKQ
jgi:uroporphyrinogen decarboxylase